jgi:hypothetical protein
MREKKEIEITVMDEDQVYVMTGIMELMDRYDRDDVLDLVERIGKEMYKVHLEESRKNVKAHH